MILVGFGASSMEGAGDTAGGFFRRLEDNDATARYERLVNLGIGGNTTRDMLARVETATAHTPRDIVVLLGCNDVPREDDENREQRVLLEEYEINLRRLLPLIKGKHSLFVSSFPVSSEQTGVQGKTLSEYMAVAQSIAATSGYETWDLHADLANSNLSLYYAPDGLHLNEAGHAMIARELATRIADWR